MIQEARSKKIRWVKVTKPTKKNLAYLWDNFPIANEDLAVTLPPLQRQRVIAYKDYVLLILQFPHYDKESGELKASELDIFVGKNFLITVTDGNLPALNEVFEVVEDTPNLISRDYKDNLSVLLLVLLDQLHQALFPMLNHISQDLDTIEQQIMSDSPTHKSSIRNILGTKRNIVNFRRIMQSHRNVVNKLTLVDSSLLQMKPIKHQFEELVSHTIEVWSTLQNFTDTINALHETHESLINFRTNEIIKTLTIFSVIVFPLTLLAAVFGMNTVYTPIVEETYGFWILIGIMLIGAAGMYAYFRHKKWI